MDANVVKTEGDFVRFINTLITEEEFNGSLEEYLRALWVVLSTKKAIEPSWGLLASSFKEAYTAPVPDFDEAWMVYQHPPVINSETPENDFASVKGMLLYQIADLRRMKGAGILDRTASDLFVYGANSPTGHKWYNFEPQAFLECAMSGTGMTEASENTELSWLFLADFLLYGQIYE